MSNTDAEYKTDWGNTVVPKFKSEDIVVWPDQTWCHYENIEEMSHMSDDYYVIPTDSPDWEGVVMFNIFPH